jgi:hypothetical protein
MQEPAIIVNGTRLADAEAEALRVAVETFAVVLAEGIAVNDEAITAALTERYRAALVSIQKLLDNRPDSVQ